MQHGGDNEPLQGLIDGFPRAKIEEITRRPHVRRNRRDAAGDQVLQIGGRALQVTSICKVYTKFEHCAGADWMGGSLYTLFRQMRVLSASLLHPGYGIESPQLGGVG